MVGDPDSVKGVRREGNAVVVELSGEIDLHHTPAVHQVLVEACEERPPRLVINLQEVSHMDSSGIGTLVEIFRRVKTYDGRLALCGLNTRVHSVFEITRLDKFFPIYPTEAEALSA